MTNSPKKKVLVTICSKNPDFGYLSQNIDYFNQILKEHEYTICIIDSDSDYLTEYQKIQAKYPSVIIHYVKNKYYEYGAYKYSYFNYPDYDIYICIQDSLIFSKIINLDLVSDSQSYIFKRNTGFKHSKRQIPVALKILRKSSFEYLQYSKSLKSKKFTLCTHCSFICTNHIMKDIFTTFTIPPKNKLGSMTYERLFGLYFIFRKIKTIDLKKYEVYKNHGGRK